MAIRLHFQQTGGPYEDFKTSDEDLKSDDRNFKRATVTTGTWIFYSYKDFNKALTEPTESNYKILKPGDEKDISTVNGSMYLMPNEVEGFILFEHSCYGGTRKYYQHSCPDVNDIFPVERVGGVSSVIILSRDENFEAFQKAKYQGPANILKAGKQYVSPEEMDFKNDALRSIRKQ